jgi:hypothetical protein
MALRIGNACNGRRRNHLAIQSGAPSIEEILDDLNASQIDASISLVTPGGRFYAELGDPTRAEVWECASIWDSVEGLSRETITLYPDSQFARRYGRGFA